MRNMLLNLPVSITKQGKRYVAYSPVLDLSTSGKNEKEAKKNFAEIVGIFFDEIIEKETIHDVLTELGWQKKQNNFTPPKLVSQTSMNFSVPMCSAA